MDKSQMLISVLLVLLSLAKVCTSLHHDGDGAMKGNEGRARRDADDGLGDIEDNKHLTAVEQCAIQNNMSGCESSLTSVRDGRDGRDGKDGERGRDGRDGEKGQKGDVGNSGAKGDSGSDGPRGLEGQPGADGRPGLGGERGTVGLKGSKGERGETPEVRRSAFSVFKTSSQAGSIGDVLSFQAEETNVGSHFSTGTSKFTCQIQGTYVFMFTISANYDSNDPCIDLVVDDRQVARARVYTAGDNGIDNHYSASHSVILQLSTGNQVWLKFCDGEQVYSDNNRYASFSGLLFYPE